jgi:hypothetical protein
MNQIKIIAIYQELLASINKIKNSKKTLSVGQKIQLAQLEEITAELKVKAGKAGFGQQMIPNDNIEIIPVDDLAQLIETSVCSADIRQELTKVVHENFTADEVSKKKLWDILQLFDKYYNANVIGVSAVTVNSRMKGDWKKIFGDKKYDLTLLATAYQHAAKETVIQEIASLSPNKWKTSIGNLDKSFQNIFKGKKAWLDAAYDMQYSVTQLKIDTHEFPLFPDSFETGYFKFTGGKVQISGKLALGSPVLLINKETLLNGYVNDFEQVLRNTVTLKKLKGAAPSFGGVSSTMLTKGVSLPFGGILSLTLKTDLAKFDWGKIYKGEQGFTMASVRLQGTANVAKVIEAIGLQDSILDLPLCKLSVSAGFNVSINWERLKKAQAKVAKNATDKIIDIDKPSLDKDKKILREIQEHNDDLLRQSKNIDPFGTTKNKKAIREAAEKLNGSANKAHKLLDNHDWYDKSLKNKASDLLNETGERIYKKIAGPLAKMTKALKYAKPLARLMPGVNAILTVIEVVGYIKDFWTWMDSVDANTWEDYFIAFGNVMEQGFFGQTFADFDRWMKGI